MGPASEGLYFSSKIHGWRNWKLIFYRKLRDIRSFYFVYSQVKLIQLFLGYIISCSVRPKFGVFGLATRIFETSGLPRTAELRKYVKRGSACSCDLIDICARCRRFTTKSCVSGTGTAVYGQSV